MADIRIIPYSSEFEGKWDRFVLQDSLNGTFLQTRNFLNYHPADRFKDDSILFMKGGTIVAVLPANMVCKDGRKILISHQGSTFGGIVLGKQYKKVAVCEDIFRLLDEYAISHSLNKICMKYTSSLYAESDSELLDYFAFLNGFTQTAEMGYYIDFDMYQDDILSNLSSSKRRDYRYSLKNNLEFRSISDADSVKIFYDILCDNYKKFEKKPVHTYDELVEFLETRLPENILFYGVMRENEMIAGAMIFLFNNVFHTQYIACRQDQTSLFANEFLYVNLIEAAKRLGFKKISFGTSTLDEGKILNRQLAQFKEAFGTVEYVNRTYTKEFSNGNTVCAI